LSIFAAELRVRLHKNNAKTINCGSQGRNGLTLRSRSMSSTKGARSRGATLLCRADRMAMTASLSALIARSGGGPPLSRSLPTASSAAWQRSEMPKSSAKPAVPLSECSCLRRRSGKVGSSGWTVARSAVSVSVFVSDSCEAPSGPQREPATTIALRRVARTPQARGCAPGRFSTTQGCSW